MLGSLGIPELLFIFGLALLVFGPKRLPEIGRAVGRGMAELRKASNDLKRTLNAEMIEQEMRDADPRKVVRDSLRDVKKSLTDAVDMNAPDPETSSPKEQPPLYAEGSVARSPRGSSVASDATSDPVSADEGGGASDADPGGAVQATDEKDGGTQ